MTRHTLEGNGRQWYASQACDDPMGSTEGPSPMWRLADAEQARRGSPAAHVGDLRWRGHAPPCSITPGESGEPERARP